eukprot:GCRY01004073.1.p1 GENE.GCRY01004073.1~~GCRY01004073.1.p1  ORF type:complete len:381 (+),score=95.74 GCRY01004073.1:160-1302(+)
MNSALEWLTEFGLKVASAGPLPSHICFIMDGNRRWASEHQLEHTEQGHAWGYKKLEETLKWCYDLGITTISIYAFSIENFKRPKREVSELMRLVFDKFDKILQKRGLSKEYGVRVRVLGNLSLLPLKVQQAAARAMELSAENSKVTLNICLSYTSRFEMLHSIHTLAAGVKTGLIRPSDVSEELFERCLFTAGCPPPEILIRTSGEIRLSDFMLWQCNHSMIQFVDHMWPDFSLWDLFKTILAYQRSHEVIQESRRRYGLARREFEGYRDRLLGFGEPNPLEVEERIELFLADCEADRQAILEGILYAAKNQPKKEEEEEEEKMQEGTTTSSRDSLLVDDDETDVAIPTRSDAAISAVDGLVVGGEGQHQRRNRMGRSPK